MTNKEFYKAICSHETDLPVFLQHWWLDAVCFEWDVVFALKGNAVTGVWPYYISRRLKVDILRNPQLTPYFGPHVFFPPDIKASNRDQFEHETIAQLIDLLPSKDVWTLSMQPGLKQAGLFRSKGLTCEVQQTFLIDLSVDEKELLANMRDPMRRNIRAAQTELEITNNAEHLIDLYNFQKATLNRKGKALSYVFNEIKRLFDACVKHNSGKLWVAKKNGEVQAIVWIVWDKERSYYLMGGKNETGDSYRAMTALLWRAILDAKQRGNKYFDLEGSMDPGVERFFRGFGGSRELYMILKKNNSRVWQMVQLLKGI